MPQPTITRDRVDGVEAALAAHAPEQGGIEYQRDLPGKIHDWHSHDVHERLVVLSGSMRLSWVDPAGAVQHAPVETGDRIELPAGTVHRSVADAEGCTYLICPEGGRAAVTTSHPTVAES